MKKLRRGQGFLAKSGYFEGDADMIGAAPFLQSSSFSSLVFQSSFEVFLVGNPARQNCRNLQSQASQS